MTTRRPVLFIRCRFSDDTGAPPHPDSHYIRLFKQICEFWEDMSYGQLDLYEGSELTPWLTLDRKFSEYVGSGLNQKGRDDLVAWAKAATTNPTRFTLVFVTTHRGVDTWGGTGRAVFGPGDQPATIMQEVGHAVGIGGHSRSVADPQDYTNPYCVMSAMFFGGRNNPPPTFTDPVLGDSGPSLCGPFIHAQGWIPEAQVVRLATDGSRPDATTLILGPLTGTTPHPRLALIELTAPEPMRYVVEYRAGRWDKALLGPPVIIHQLRSDGLPYYAGEVNAKTRRPYRDPRYDLSVSVETGASANAVTVHIAAADAVGTLSVRNIAAQNLGLNPPFSVRSAIMADETSLRSRLIRLL